MTSCLGIVGVVSKSTLISVCNIVTLVCDVVMASNKVAFVRLVVLVEHIGMMAVEELLSSQVILEGSFIPKLVKEVHGVLLIVEGVILTVLILIMEFIGSRKSDVKIIHFLIV